METGRNSKEEGFSIQYSNRCHLALNIFSNSIRIGISDLHRKRHVYFNTCRINSWANDFEAFFQFEFGNAKFKSVSACFFECDNIIVPSGMYSDANKSALFNYSFDATTKRTLSHDSIGVLESVNLYDACYEVEKALISSVKNYKVKHYQSILLELLGREVKSSEEKRSYIHVSENCFDLVVFDTDKLIFCNRFDYTSTEDFIYFLLNCFEQLEISIQNTAVFLMGDIREKDELHEILCEYCKDWVFMKDFGAYTYDDGLELQSHEEYILFNQLLCA